MCYYTRETSEDKHKQQMQTAYMPAIFHYIRKWITDNEM